ncbi:hypothetical protein SASPL_120567 [Salvia splendens]|uniref:Protein EARLY FLOWERING 4 domain-containing protein n=1 Tax=Salvia splendens TaxID=180675 RepID=A0A8X8ZWD2_SALSN|nr:hypothetical protein SASPL_120567 [Salvia splendens]
MEDVIFSSIATSGQIEPKFQQRFQTNFVLVQNILDQNRLLINEINQNHESKILDKLSRNVGLIRELNNNIRRVVDLYGRLSNSARSMETLSEGESAGTTKSDGRGGLKRVRSVIALGLVDASLRALGIVDAALVVAYIPILIEAL